MNLDDFWVSIEAESPDWDEVFPPDYEDIPDPPQGGARMKNPKPVFHFSITSVQAMHRLKSTFGHLYQILDEDAGQIYFVYADYKESRQTCSCRQEPEKSKNLCPHIKFLQKHPTIFVDGTLFAKSDPGGDSWRDEPMRTLVVVSRGESK